MAITYSKSTDGINWPNLKRDLAEDQFDNGRTPSELRKSFENSAVVAFAFDKERVIGKGRAISDGICNAYVIDMWTQSSFRRRGIASRIMELLIEDLNGQHVYLFTDDEQSFYEQIGFSRQGSGYSRIVGRWLNRPKI